MSFLIRPISFIFIIFFAYFLKRIGLLKKEHAQIVMKIVVNVTLPAVAIQAFADFNHDYSLLFIALIGFGAAVFSYFFMYLLTRRMDDKAKRSYYLISSAGYNVGCYGLPVIQSFYGTIGSITCILFDIGNGVMMASGNYALTSTLLKTEGEDTKFRAGTLLKRLFSSVSCDVYLILLVLGLLSIPIPQGLVEFISPIASSNAFLSMFMLGLLFTLPKKRSDWKQMFHILAFRFGIAFGLGFLLFYLLPYTLEIRQLIFLLLLCPIGSVSPGFIEQCHGDGELAAFTNSACNICSMIVITLLAGWIFAT